MDENNEKSVDIEVNSDDKVDYVKHKKSTWLRVKGSLMYWGSMAVFVLVLLFINACIISGYTVSGESMRETFQDKDFGINLQYHFLNKLGALELKKNDIVIFWSDELDEYLIKRCVATEGDTISMIDGVLTVNGEEVDQSYIREPMDGNDYIPEMTLEEGYFFAMGDNRNNSTDCRDLGAISYDDLKGIVLYNFGQNGSIKFKGTIIGIIAILLLLSFIGDARTSKRYKLVPEQYADFEVDYDVDGDGYLVGLRNPETGELMMAEKVADQKGANQYAKKYGRSLYYKLQKEQ